MAYSTMQPWEEIVYAFFVLVDFVSSFLDLLYKDILSCCLPIYGQIIKDILSYIMKSIFLETYIICFPFLTDLDCIYVCTFYL